MKKYVALLRGINVAGHRKIKMDDLTELFHSYGFENVQTYIQSGNVIFDSEITDESQLSVEISGLILKNFGHDVPVFIREPREISGILREFPFKKKQGWKRYVSFLTNEPDTEIKKQFESFSSNAEKFSISGSHLFSFIDKETDEKTLFTNSFVEKKMGLQATTRNLRTVGKILELSRP